MNIISTNTHVPYNYLLAKIPNVNIFLFSFRYQGRDWQSIYRPKPKNLVHIPIDEPNLLGLYLHPDFMKNINRIIIHQFSDLDIFCNSKHQWYSYIQPIKKYFVFHNSLFTEFGGTPPEVINQRVTEIKQTFQANNITPVFISQWKAETWQIAGAVIKPGIDQREIKRNWTGRNINLVIGEKFREYSIRVCSNFEHRDFMNGYKMGSSILGNLPEYADLILGEGNTQVKQKNPNSVFTISQNYAHYLDTLSRARFMLTANNAQFEDWYNLSSLEAIALGLPLVATYHERMNQHKNFQKQFPIVSDDPAYLISECKKLFTDYEYAQHISKLNQDFIDNEFPLSSYIQNWSGILA